MNSEHLQTLLAMKRLNPQTGQEEYDYEAQQIYLNELKEGEIRANIGAIAAMNELGEKMVCWSRNHEVFMHLSCSPDEVPEGFTKEMISQEMRSIKCIGCGFTLDSEYA